MFKKNVYGYIFAFALLLYRLASREFLLRTRSWDIFRYNGCVSFLDPEHNTVLNSLTFWRILNFLSRMSTMLELPTQTLFRWLEVPTYVEWYQLFLRLFRNFFIPITSSLLCFYIWGIAISLMGFVEANNEGNFEAVLYPISMWNGVKVFCRSGILS